MDDTRSPEQLRREARRHRRMADEIAGYPEFDERTEHVRNHRSEAHYLYEEARRRERPSTTPRGAARGARTSSATTATPSSPEPWSPTRALRRAGLSTGRRADSAARNAPRRAARTARSSGALPNLGGEQGAGGLIVYVFASIVLLALLDNALGGRGPGGVSKLLGIFGGGISKLVNASDPIIARGTLPGASPASPTPVTAATSGRDTVSANHPATHT